MYMTGFTIRLQRCRIGTGGVRRLISIRCSNSVFFVTDNIMMDKAFVWLCIPLMLLTPGLAPLSGGCGITAKVTMRDGNVRTAEEAQTLALDESAVSTVEIWCRNTPPRYTIHHDNEQVYERTSSTPPRYVLERFAVEQQGEYRCNCQSVSGARLNLVVIPGFHYNQFVGTAVKGDTVHLPCQLTNIHPGLSLYEVRWRRGDVNIVYGERHSKMTNNSLIIEDFQEEDTKHSYYCYITKIGSDDFGGNFPVSGPRQLRMLEAPQPEILTGGGTVSCSANTSFSARYCLTITYFNRQMSWECESKEVKTRAEEDIKEITCEVTVFSNASSTNSFLSDDVSSPTPPSNNSTIIVFSAILAALLLSAVGVCVSIVACAYYRSRKSRRRVTERLIQSVEFHRSGQANTEVQVVNFLTISEDAWEIPRSEIEVGGKVGQGNYGAVFKGQLTVTAMSPKIYTHKQEMEFEGKSHFNVAVKMLRRGSRNHERKLFMDEINVMKRVSDGNNPHILKMLGCVTTTNPMMLILQFVPHGNLKDYLRAMKAADDGGDFKTTGADPAPGVTPGSQSCSSLPTQAPDIAPLLKKFTSFSYQIASGMVFLTSKEVIHRDLACRNVLVGDNELLKICDFGLAKETLEYMSPSALIKTKLPIRWLSPEVFLRGEFSEKSDVWAYGVCLWEIFSFGDQPYSELGNTVLLSSIMAGYRLEPPKGCPDRVYSIMKECWNDDKESRPTFLELKEKFDAFMSHKERYNYLQLDSEAMESVVPTPQPPKCSESEQEAEIVILESTP